jgi:hypothetical protein
MACRRSWWAEFGASNHVTLDVSERAGEIPLLKMVEYDVFMSGSNPAAISWSQAGLFCWTMPIAE